MHAHTRKGSYTREHVHMHARLSSRRVVSPRPKGWAHLWQAQFRQGLGASNLWYGHASALTLVQSKLPRGFSGTTYEQSGWVRSAQATRLVSPGSDSALVRQCFVEASLSSTLKSVQRRVDIGAFTEKALFSPLVQWAMEKSATGTRPPIRHPDQVAEMLETKTFFARADVATVAKLYRDFFEAVAPWCDRLELQGLGWGVAEAGELAAALPSFARLSVLNLSANNLRAEGLRMLVGWMGASASLTEVCPLLPASRLQCVLLTPPL